MKKELTKRIITSLLLILLFILAIQYTYILIISLIITSLISWIEFNGLFAKIFIKSKFKINIQYVFFKIASLLYLIFFSVIVFYTVSDPLIKNYTIYFFCTCISSDVGGLMFGKFFGGKKLTKISPNKTISGTIGSFTISLILTPFFIYFIEYSSDPILVILLTIITSLSCQLGDLFISYLKRKANVKNTGDLLPGHGGVLDRIDGILFAVPIALIILICL